MTFALRSPCLLAGLTGLALALSACQQEQKPEQKGTAAGEILPGSASDAMLPYDTVQSQPPLAPLPIATDKAATKSSGGAESEAGTEASDAAAEASPVATPVTVPQVVVPVPVQAPSPR